MKVLEINSVYGSGSTGRIACQIGSVVVHNGGECYVAYARFKNDKASNIPSYKIGSKASILFHALGTRLFDRQGFFSYFATKRFLRFIDEYNPDIIHMHNIHGYYLNLKLLFTYIKQKNIPVVWTLHDCWPFTGHCAYFDYVGCNKWINGCYLCPQKKKYPSSYLFDSSRKNWIQKKELFTSIPNMVLVTPSYWLANLASKSFLKEYSIKMIHNGIDLSKFYPRQQKQRDHKQKCILACASGWDKMKGKYDLPILANYFPEQRIIVVGMEKREAQGFPPNIYPIERTESVDELATLYSQADVFVNPTYEDNYPTTNLEAIACGTPVVTYDTGGSAESIVSDCGLAVPKGNVTALCQAVFAILNGPCRREACLKKAKEFDMNLCFANYFDLFRRIVE